MTPEKIKKIRKTVGENQNTFARRFGVRQQFISQWERGIRSPKPLFVSQLEDIWEERAL